MVSGSRQSFEKLWDKVIDVSINKFSRLPEVSCSKTAKEDIWKEYQNFNKHCKEQYMRDPEGRLDRHKVASCYMLAILKAYPLSIDFSPDNEILITLNEHLAIEIGLSILKTFITAPKDNDEVEDFPKINPEEDVKIFDKGFNFPKEHDEIFHGEYRKNFAIELYFTHKEKSYNILSLSHSLYLLELYNRKQWEINNR